jgi:L-ribulose-5-phosphate 4-epimerase
MESGVLQPPLALHELRERVVDANVRLAREGLVELTFGNASAVDRAAGLMAIKPSGVPFEALRADDIPVLDLATGNIVAGGLRPSSDSPTHLALYRAFPGIAGVVHTHSPYATAWAQACRAIPCLGTTHADHFAGPVPVTRTLRADEIAARYEDATGAVIVETLGATDPLTMPAVLVCSHGPFTWGVGPEEAVENAVALEVVAASAYRALRIATDTAPIADDLLAKHFGRKHGLGSYYGQPS